MSGKAMSLKVPFGEEEGYVRSGRASKLHVRTVHGKA